MAGPLFNDSDWKTVPATPNCPGYSVYVPEIQKSPKDDRSYRLILLENGIQAMLISDPAADSAAVSLDVAVGQMMDPVDLQGLAHLCEHMIFLGKTEQYPNDGDFTSYIYSNSGYATAHTAESSTNYSFTVASSALPEAMRRFSSSFHSPLFTPSATMGEVLAVDSEQKMYYQQDVHRIYQVFKSISRPDHVWRIFGTGNHESLTGKKLADFTSPDTIDIVADASTTKDSAAGEISRKLAQWWSQQYCSSRMKLVVQAKDSLNALSEMIATLFTPVAHRGLEPYPLTPNHPYGEEQLGRTVFIKALSNTCYLELSFPIPFQAPHFRIKPRYFVGHVLAHQGPGSLLSYLQSKGWASSVGISAQEMARGTEIFGLKVHLTSNGLIAYREVATAIYKYISLIRNSPLPKFVHSELKVSCDLWFSYQEKGEPRSYVAAIAEKMQRPFYPRDEILKASYLIWDWDDRPIREILDSFDINHGLMLIVAKDVDSVAPKGEWKTERWYGAKYMVVENDRDFIEMASSPNDIEALSLPTPNEFMPKNLSVDVKNKSEPPLSKPVLVRETSLSSLWHKTDDQFSVPHAHVSLTITSPLVNSSPRYAIMSELFTNLVNNALSQYAYFSRMAGLSYHFKKFDGELSLYIGGYNERIALLLRRILETVKGLNIEKQTFEIMKQSVMSELQDYSMKEPRRLGIYWTRYLLSSDRWSHADRLEELRYVTQEALSWHVVELLSRVHVEGLIHGNVHVNESIEMMSMVEDILQSRPLTLQERIFPRDYILPTGGNFIWKKTMSNADEPNSSLSYYCQVGTAWDGKKRVILRLLSQIIEEPFYHQLRTQEQLGYAVGSDHRVWNTSIGLCFSVQSERDPSYCEARIDAFLEKFVEDLRKMTEADFQMNRDSLAKKMEKKPKNLRDENSTFWAHISSGFQDFDRGQTDADSLRKIKLEDLIDLFVKYVHPSSPIRSKISVHMISNKLLAVTDPNKSENEDVNRKMPTKFIADIADFKSSLEMSKAPSPMHVACYN